MDTTVNPAEDFYRYATGGWLDSHPIPEDESYYDVTIELQRKVDQQIISIINDLISHKQKPGTIEDKIATLYKGCLDTAKTFSEGLKPIQFLFDSLDNIKSALDIQDGFALLQKYCINTPLNFWINAIFEDSTKIYVFDIHSDCYIYNDLKYYEDSSYIERYKKYIAKLFEILGQDSISSQNSAEIVYNIDYELAQEALSTYDQPSDETITFDELCNLTPNIDWNKMYSILEWNKPKNILPSCGEKYLIKVSEMTESIPVENWILFLKFQIMNDIGTTTNRLTYNEYNSFIQFIKGAEEPDDLSNQALNCVDFIFDEAIGKLYTEKYYSDKTTNIIKSIADNVRLATAEHIENTDWMTDDTKKIALQKLDAIKIKIGHPKIWNDYSQTITDSSFVFNLASNLRIESKIEFESLDKPLEEDFWYSMPQQTNAFYVHSCNSIEIDAAFIQPPFFYPNGDDAVNYGLLGATIAHEITHGFDNYGKEFDYNGSIHNWWKPEDSIEFVKRTQTLIDRFNSFIAIDTMHADGEYTLEENIADLGGLEIAYTAFTKTEQWKDQTKLIDGLTPDQRFFIAYAQSMAGQYRNEAIINLTLTDVHSLSQYRVEGPLPSIEAFTKAFNIKPGDRYYLPDSLKTQIW